MKSAQCCSAVVYLSEVTKFVADYVAKVADAHTRMKTAMLLTWQKWQMLWQKWQML